MRKFLISCKKTRKLFVDSRYIHYTGEKERVSTYFLLAFLFFRVCVFKAAGGRRRFGNITLHFCIVLACQRRQQTEESARSAGRDGLNERAKEGKTTRERWKLRFIRNNKAATFHAHCVIVRRAELSFRVSSLLPLHCSLSHDIKNIIVALFRCRYFNVNEHKNIKNVFIVVDSLSLNDTSHSTAWLTNSSNSWGHSSRATIVRQTQFLTPEWFNLTLNTHIQPISSWNCERKMRIEWSNLWQFVSSSSSWDLIVDLVQSMSEGERELSCKAALILLHI